MKTGQGDVLVNQIWNDSHSSKAHEDVSPVDYRRTALLPSLVFVAGLLLSVVIGSFWQLHNQKLISERLTEITNQTEQLVEDSFALYEYGLRGLRGAIVTAGHDNLSRQVIERYIASRDHEREFPGARGFGFIRFVTQAETNVFLEAARADQRPNFALRELNQNDGDRFIIQYIYPENGNEGATGLDIASERNRRTAAMSAVQTGEVRLTEPITLVQADGKVNRGFLILLPIYESDVPINTPVERRDAIWGWSYAPLVVDEVLAKLSGSFQNISLSLTDGVAQEPFFISDTNGQHPMAAFAENREINILGRHWVLRTEALPSIYNALNLFSPMSIGIIGFFASALSSGLLWWGVISRYRSDEIVEHNQMRLGAFLRAPMTLSVIMFVVIMATVVCVISGLYLWYTRWQEVSRQLISQSSEAGIIYDNRYDDYKLAVRFLSAGIETSNLFKEKISTGTPSAEEYREWRKQVSNSFSAFMLSSESVRQARFIGLANNGKEIVRVQYRNGNIYVTPDSELQRKGREPYMKEAARLPHGSAWVSNVTLNRENGKIEMPETPTVRFVAPVYSSVGEVFGIVIVNIDWRRMLSEMRLARPGFLKFILNKDGNFLLHPSPSMSFSFERRTGESWYDLYKKEILPWGVEPNLFAWQNNAGRYLISSVTSIRPNEGSNTGEVIFVYAKPAFDVYLEIFKILTVIVLLACFVGVVLLSLYHFRWKRDIRERILQEKIASSERLRSQEGLIRGVLGFAPEAMIVADEEGKVFFANNQASSLFCYSIENIIGEQVDVFLSDDDVDKFQESFLSQLRDRSENNSNNVLEVVAKKRNNVEFPVVVRLSDVEFEKKSIVVMSFRDLTDDIVAKRVLTDAKEAAEQASVAKGAFMANISHEIRTPLNAILGLTTLLMNGRASEEQKDYLNKINLAGRSLLGIVNDVLDLSKIEAGEMALDEVVFSPYSQVSDLAKIYETQAEIANLEFFLETPGDLPDELIGDNNRLRQILTNLVGNAIKFTDKGSVTLRIEIVQSEHIQIEDVVFLRFTVIDTGIGIPVEKQNQLFKPFSQADSSTSRRFGGTGLGLSIVSQLATLMGGSCGLESESGTGSEFWVELPFKPVQENLSENYQKSSYDFLVFLVEDNDVENDFLKNLMALLGWSVVSMKNGVDFISEYLRRFNHNGVLPDVVVVDWQLPGQDGLAVLAQLASEVGRESLPPTLMVSAFDREKIAEIDTEKLVDRILAKPVDGSTLFNVVNDVISLRTGRKDKVLAGTKTDTLAVNWLHNIKAMVVDDSPLNLEVATYLLQDSGAIVTAVSSGEECLEILGARSTEFDVVLMDVQMPGMDGYEVTKLIRSELGLKNLPVLALTAGALLEERKLAKNAGMDDFLTKPIVSEQLIHRVRKAVELATGEAIPITSRVEMPSGDANAQEVGKTESEPLSLEDDVNMNPNAELPLWDRQIALRLSGENDALVKRLVGLYVPQVREHISQLSEALQNKDSDTAARSLHVLQGASSQIGAQRLADFARDLEIVTRQEGLKQLEYSILEIEKLAEETLAMIDSDNNAVG